MASVVSGGFFLHNNTSEFLHSTVQTTLDGSVPLSEVFFPSVVVCNINQIRKSFFAELGFYENDTLVRIMYEDFIKGTMDADWEASEVTRDPKRDAFYDVSKKSKCLFFPQSFVICTVYARELSASKFFNLFNVSILIFDVILLCIVFKIL